MNPDELGFYRVNYDKKSWKALKDQLMTNHSVRRDFGWFKLKTLELKLVSINEIYFYFHLH